SDHLGTIRDIADFNEATGITAIANHRVYNSFGKLMSQTGTTDIVFGYTGKLYDKTTGLQNNWNRWYDPNLGKWMSQDPIGFEAGDANLYRYVGNRVTTHIDPSGWREVDGFPVKGTGHHLLPVELWKLLGFAREMYPLLDKATIPTPNGHNNTSHGSAIGYSGHVREFMERELGCYSQSKKIKDGKLTLEQQKEFLELALGKIRSRQAGKFITGYNIAARKGIEAVAEWWENTGSKLKLPSKFGGAKILGVAKVARIFTFFYAFSNYNNLRAEGQSPASAATAAGLDAFNPTPIGPLEILETGRKYGEFYDDMRCSPFANRYEGFYRDPMNAQNGTGGTVDTPNGS
ncbi:MAG: RHS repeat-associated core domain-containing protein, partial [Pirellulaceae bacterium]|nr:RHS repeat-associated core domain-containing protein [Pirellulaceae bacterium]